MYYHKYARSYSPNTFSVFSKANSEFNFNVLEAVYIKSNQPSLRNQK